MESIQKEYAYDNSIIDSEVDNNSNSFEYNLSDKIILQVQLFTEVDIITLLKAWTIIYRIFKIVIIIDYFISVILIISFLLQNSHDRIEDMSKEIEELRNNINDLILEIEAGFDILCY